MFEKEAEEYLKKDGTKAEQILNMLNEISPLKIKIKQLPYILAMLQQIYQDGAEFGYNKSNEWHYVKYEFPPENVPLNIITFDKDKKKRLWEGEYKGGNGKYWSGYFNHYIDVPYAWKEIVLPELKGRNEQKAKGGNIRFLRSVQKGKGGKDVLQIQM